MRSPYQKTQFPGEGSTCDRNDTKKINSASPPVMLHFPAQGSSLLNHAREFKQYGAVSRVLYLRYNADDGDDSNETTTRTDTHPC